MGLGGWFCAERGSLCREKFGWNKDKVDQMLDPVIKAFEERTTQLRLEHFYGFKERFATISSKRIRKAVASLTAPENAARLTQLEEGGPGGGNKTRSSTGNGDDDNEDDDEDDVALLKKLSSKSKAGRKNKSKANQTNKTSRTDATPSASGRNGSSRGRGRGRGRGKAQGQYPSDVAVTENSDAVTERGDGVVEGGSNNGGVTRVMDGSSGDVETPAPSTGKSRGRGAAAAAIARGRGRTGAIANKSPLGRGQSGAASGEGAGDVPPGGGAEVDGELVSGGRQRGRGRGRGAVVGRESKRKQGRKVDGVMADDDDDDSGDDDSGEDDSDAGDVDTRGGAALTARGEPLGTASMNVERLERPKRQAAVRAGGYAEQGSSSEEEDDEERGGGGGGDVGEEREREGAREDDKDGAGTAHKRRGSLRGNAKGKTLAKGAGGKGGASKTRQAGDRGRGLESDEEDEDEEWAPTEQDVARKGSAAAAAASAGGWHGDGEGRDISPSRSEGGGDEGGEMEGDGQAAAGRGVRGGKKRAVAATSVPCKRLAVTKKTQGVEDRELAQGSVAVDRAGTAGELPAGTGTGAPAGRGKGAKSFGGGDCLPGGDTVTPPEEIGALERVATAACPTGTNALVPALATLHARPSVGRRVSWEDEDLDLGDGLVAVTDPARSGLVTVHAGGRASIGTAATADVRGGYHQGNSGGYHEGSAYGGYSEGVAGGGYHGGSSGGGYYQEEEDEEDEAEAIEREAWLNSRRQPQGRESQTLESFGAPTSARMSAVLGDGMSEDTSRQQQGPGGVVEAAAASVGLEALGGFCESDSDGEGFVAAPVAAAQARRGGGITQLAGQRPTS
eukprot:jgi/Mesvir1/11998/Mv00304-RA.2